MTLAAPTREAAFLERAGELDVLDKAFEATSASGGRLVLVAGEAGVGKTVLLRRFCERRARRRGSCGATATRSSRSPRSGR